MADHQRQQALRAARRHGQPFGRREELVGFGIMAVWDEAGHHYFRCFVPDCYWCWTRRAVEDHCWSHSLEEANSLVVAGGQAS